MNGNVEKVYHYTSIAGLQGILENSMIRLVNTEYLNDINEIKHGYESLIDFLKYHWNDEDKQNFKEAIVNQLEDLNSSIKKDFIYTTSFSKDGNSLSQWQAYCPPEGGYAVGFDRASIQQEFIDDIETTYPYMSGEIQYNTDASDTVVQFVKTYLEKFPKDGIFSKETGEDIYYTLANILLRYTFFTKDPSFVDEKEFRIVKVTSKNTSSFFTKGSILAPYFPYKFEKNIVKEVVIGPMKHQEIAQKSLLMFRDANEYSFDVVLSEIPFRTF